MRPNCLLLACAAASLSAAEPLGQNQPPIVVYKDVTTSVSYPKGPLANRTYTALSSIQPAGNSTSAPSAISTAAADLPAPALEKSMFSLIIFGIAGLCLV